MSPRQRKRGLRPEGMITVPIPRIGARAFLRQQRPPADYTREHQAVQARRHLPEKPAEDAGRSTP